MHVNVQVQGLSTGLHGIHIHAVGSCVAPTFASAGGHYNPLAHQHGLENPNGPHAGDLPNLIVDETGHGRLQARTDRVTLTAGTATLLDGDGSAFIIHANRDDQVTDAGNGGSGARIACAVIVARRASSGRLTRRCHARLDVATRAMLISSCDISRATPRGGRC